MHPVDFEIKKIKKSLFRNFTNKWSRHVHAKPTLNCNKILVLDGNWKTNRLKCSYDNYWRQGVEFDDYRVGCPNTPQRLNYFCHEHKDFKLQFQMGTETIQLQPKDIHISRISKLLSLFKNLLCYCTWVISEFLFIGSRK